MKRTVTLELGGKKYALRNTLAAMEWLQENFGDLTKLLETMGDYKTQVKTMIDVTAVLMKQGAAYENRFGDPDSDFERDANGNVVYISRDDIAVMCDSEDILNLTLAILEAFNLGNATEIEATETSETKKSKKKGKAIPEVTK